MSEQERQKAIKEEKEKSEFAAKVIAEYEQSGEARPAFDVDALWKQKKEQEAIEAEEAKKPAKKNK